MTHPVYRHLQTLGRKYPDLSGVLPQVEAAFKLLEACYRQGGKLLVAGNGGSASDSDHIVGELMKGFMRKREVPESFREKMGRLFADEGLAAASKLQGALPAIALTQHSALITAFVNDADADLVFAQQVYGYGRPEDVLLVLSTSGNSRNVVHAVQVAKALGLRTIGLTGGTGGKLGALCDVAVIVPYETTPAIQERHLPVYHTLCIMLEEAFFG